MGKRITVGARMPFFTYDTPYSTANSFRRLLEEQAPLVLVFMSNFGHPVTRTFVARYAHSRHRLLDGGFAMVVRSDPARLAANVGPGTLPYPLLCDAEGALYDLLDIPVRSGFWRTCSLEAWQILKKARRRGYNVPSGAPQQMPLTLILSADGTVLFCHYGTSLTDVPADCGAMQSLLDELNLLPGDESEEAGEATLEPDAEEEEEEEEPLTPLPEAEEGDGFDDGEALPGGQADPQKADPADAAPPQGEADGLTRDSSLSKLSATFLRGILDDPYQDD